MNGPATDPENDRAARSTEKTTVIRAVVPCFNRRDDLEVVLGDLAATNLGDSVRLDVVVVDNASDTPLSEVPHPDGLRVEHLRMPTNLGGSGGYNAGMAAVMQAEPRPDYVWLVDSDARVDRDTLGLLLETLDNDRSAVAIGPALCDPETKTPFEIGGRVEPWGGGFMGENQRIEELANPDRPFECDYVAACCALVRSDAIERTGLFPEVFLNGDDVEWFIRLAADADGRVLCRPDARGYHPRFDKVPTMARYFLARNAYGAIAAKEYGPIVRHRRARVETMRALNQVMMNRLDLARIHLRGLRDAARGRTTGRPADGKIEFEAFRPYSEFADAIDEHGLNPCRIAAYLPPDVAGDGLDHVLSVLRDRGFDIGQTSEHDHRTDARESGLSGFILRAVVGPPHRVAVVPAKGRPAYWFVAPTTIQLAEHGFVIRKQLRPIILLRAAQVFLRGQWLALRLALRGPGTSRLPSVNEIASRHTDAPPRADSLSIIVLSYNRKDSLTETLRSLRDDPATRDAEIIVVDNASTDGTTDLVAAEHSDVRLMPLSRNIGVEAFNIGVRSASGDVVLILDDDARPDEGAIDRAMDALRNDGSLAAVTLEPRHPSNKNTEWPFAGLLDAPVNDWPVMGCGNLVRRRDWLAVGGYEGDYFLYRNDADLALKLLAAGRGVRFDPALVVWHDSPAAKRKSRRWFRSATRNWVWMCKRHGGPRWLRHALLGWAWAHKTAGLSAPSQIAALRGGTRGLISRAPALPGHIRPDGNDLDRLITLQMSARRQ